MQIDAAVGASLTLGVGHQGQPEFDVQLKIRPEFLFGHDVAAARHHLHVTVLDFPIGGLAVPFAPGRQILPVEQHHRVFGGRGCLDRVIIGPGF